MRPHGSQPTHSSVPFPLLPLVSLLLSLSLSLSLSPSLSFAAWFPVSKRRTDATRRQAPAVPFNRAIKTRMGLWFMPLLLLTIPTRGERVSSIPPLSLTGRSFQLNLPSSITGISSLFANLLRTIKSLIAHPLIHKLLLYEPRCVEVRDIHR